MTHQAECQTVTRVTTMWCMMRSFLHHEYEPPCTLTAMQRRVTAHGDIQESTHTPALCTSSRMPSLPAMHPHLVPAPVISAAVHVNGHAVHGLTGIMALAGQRHSPAMPPASQLCIRTSFLPQLYKRPSMSIAMQCTAHGPAATVAIRIPCDEVSVKSTSLLLLGSKGHAAAMQLSTEAPPNLEGPMHPRCRPGPLFNCYHFYCYHPAAQNAAATGVAAAPAAAAPAAVSAAAAMLPLK